MVTYDQAAFEKLVRELMRSHHRGVADFYTATEVIKDKYGEVVALTPYLSVKFKTDSELINEFSKNKAIRVRH